MSHFKNRQAKSLLRGALFVHPVNRRKCRVTALELNPKGGLVIDYVELNDGLPGDVDFVTVRPDFELSVNLFVCA